MVNTVFRFVGGKCNHWWTIEHQCFCGCGEVESLRVGCGPRVSVSILHKLKDQSREKRCDKKNTCAWAAALNFELTVLAGRPQPMKVIMTFN